MVSGVCVRSFITPGDVKKWIQSTVCRKFRFHSTATDQDDSKQRLELLLDGVNLYCFLGLVSFWGSSVVAGCWVILESSYDATEVMDAWEISRILRKWLSSVYFIVSYCARGPEAGIVFYAMGRFRFSDITQRSITVFFPS
jgi:hypothetical protein